MSILIVGCEGNMGRRYASILQYLGVSWEGVDRAHSATHILNRAMASQGIIIATPTLNHLDQIHRFSHLKIPLLCEKPISKDIYDLRETLSELDSNRTPFRMMYQYSLLAPQRGKKGKTFYNYYKHGMDQLAWDCIQILGLASEEVVLQETSPIWLCTINGKALDIAQMDSAYIEYIKLWMKSPSQSLNEILDAHLKVILYIADQKKAGGNA